MFRTGSDNVDSIENLKDKVKEGITKLKGLEIGDELAVEILAQLVESKKTAAEIVERVYGLQNSDEGFISSYGRVWREIRRLESRGLVSTGILGRNKPYRLTQLAIINLARIGGEEQQLPLVPKIDAIAYACMLGNSLLIIALAMGWCELSELGTLGLFGSFCFFLGLSVYGALRGIRRVL